jgi:hypothetical protein
VPSSISFRSKPYDFVPCLNQLKVILPVPEVILFLFLGKFVGWGSRDLLVGSERESLVHSISNRNPDKWGFRVTRRPLTLMDVTAGFRPCRMVDFRRRNSDFTGFELLFFSTQDLVQI